MEKIREFLKDKQKSVPVIIFILGLFSMFFAYFFVNRGSTEESTSETKPTPQITPIEEQIQSVNSPTPTPKTTFSPTKTPSPTQKPAEPSNTPAPSPTTEPKNTTISSIASLDGFRSSNNGGNDSIEIRVRNGAMVGAPEYELVTRGFVSFDISTLPDNATIVKATLRLYQYQVDGTPFTAGGSIKIDHMDYGASLESADYDASAINANIATLTSNSGIEWKDAEVTNAVKKDIDEGHSKSQYRLHFATEEDGDGEVDTAYFYSANSGHNTNPPQLVVSYTE
jgi:hypothetical protein